MLRLKDQFYQPIDERMRRLFWDIYFKPLIELVDIPMPRLNSADDAILSAIRSGQVQYQDGVFSGQFNAKISRQLAGFAKFDSRSKTWKGKAPPSIIGASIIAEGKRKDLMARMDFALNAAERNINDALASLSLGDSLPLPLMREAVIKDLWSVGVQPHLSERAEAALRKDYTSSQKLNIKNWQPEQVQRLREMVRRIQTTSDNSSIRELIQSEWNTSAAKAKFLARQETALFFGAFGREGAKSAGVRRYRWSTSHDVRVRDSHKHLDGQIIDIDGPGPIVDLKTGRRAHAGEDYNDRCAKIWILD
jgi:SPP1 gp7 family putative phage head morphogenesis protein